MSALLGSESNDALTALLGSGVGGSGSMLSFEDFMKEYGSMFGSGSSAIDLFGDSSTPQNNTVNDDDILLGELYGGKEHGDAFSDIKNIKFGQMILNITVRGQERVDSIGITVMTQEAVGNLVHGGEGGTEGFIEPTMGDTIDSVEVHWDKNKGKTCIFYLKMTTSGGKTIATGTKTANSAVMKPPKGYQLAGFYGPTDLAVTDVMAITSKGSPDIYNYETTIRNWVGPLEVANDNACYQKRVDVSSQGMCPSGFNKDDDNFRGRCFALNAATLGVFGTLVAAYRAANFALTCAINVVNAVKSLIYYLRYKQTTIPTPTRRS
ncbi:Jacalin-like lectin domain [Phytophthora cactorum]|nr:Jacalin-like lectin domain [Phytophthora cactorum]